MPESFHVTRSVRSFGEPCTGCTDPSSTPSTDLTRPETGPTLGRRPTRPPGLVRGAAAEMFHERFFASPSLLHRVQRVASSQCRRSLWPTTALLSSVSGRLQLICSLSRLAIGTPHTFTIVSDFAKSIRSSCSHDVPPLVRRTFTSRHHDCAYGDDRYMESRKPFPSRR